MAAVSPAPKSGAPQRGRPRAAVYSPEEVAEFLGVEVTRVLRALESRKLREDTFPHATQKDGAWIIPNRDMLKLLGPGMPRLLPVAEFAELIGFSVPYVNELIGKGVIKHRMALGNKRIPASEYWDLPPHRPSCLRKFPELNKEVTNGHG